MRAGFIRFGFVLGASAILSCSPEYKPRWMRDAIGEGTPPPMKVYTCACKIRCPDGTTRDMTVDFQNWSSPYFACCDNQNYGARERERACGMYPRCECTPWEWSGKDGDWRSLCTLICPDGRTQVRTIQGPSASQGGEKPIRPDDIGNAECVSRIGTYCPDYSYPSVHSGPWTERK
jgi:hypothetical protein